MTMNSNEFDSFSDTNVQVRGRIRVKASIDTAVGAVGVDFRLQGDSDFLAAAQLFK